MTIITVETVCDLTGAAPSTVQNWCAKNNIKRVNDGSKKSPFILSMEDLESFKNRAKKGYPKGRKRK